MPEPAGTPWIERFPVEVAEKRDRVALDVAAKAFRTGLVIDGEPKERHRANQLTHFTFESALARAQVGRRISAVSPAWKPVTASACLLLTAMLLEPVPEFRP